MFIFDDGTLGEGFDHVREFWVEYETPSVPETQWHFQCALWLQEESNDTLQHVEVFVGTMAHN